MRDGEVGMEGEGWGMERGGDGEEGDGELAVGAVCVGWGCGCLGV